MVSLICLQYGGLGSLVLEERIATTAKRGERVSDHLTAAPGWTHRISAVLVKRMSKLAGNDEPTASARARRRPTYVPGRGIPPVTPPVTPHLRGVGIIRMGKIRGRRAGGGSSLPTSNWSRSSASGSQAILEDVASNKGCGENRNTTLPAAVKNRAKRRATRVM